MLKSCRTEVAVHFLLSARMDQLFLTLLVLLSVHRGQAWTVPDFCHQQQCPEYTVVETNKEFEVRKYVATDWITTEVESTDAKGIMDANSRLKDYCKRQKDTGYEIPVDTWPVLITSIDGGAEYFLSWFVPPGTKEPENSDPHVRLQTRPETTVYVRVFGGTPSLESGEQNAKILQEALEKAGKNFDRSTYVGVGYDHYLSLTHHNELWIYTA